MGLKNYLQSKRTYFRFLRSFIRCFYTPVSIRREISFEQNEECISKAVGNVLFYRYGSIKVNSTAASYHFEVRRGFVTRAGKIVLHLGVVFITVGVLIGTIARLDGQLFVGEGERSNVIFVGENTFILPFSVKLDRFHVAYYENGTPNEILSEISISREGIVEEGTLSVNRPYKFDGFYLFLVSHGSLREGKGTRSYNQIRVVYDPGLPFLFAGAILLVLGISFTFLFSGIQVNVDVDPLSGVTLVVFSGVTHGFKIPLEREIGYLIGKVSQEGRKIKG
ncbi:MAG: cytochrome c biogenesis protein ResB [Syntrophales bacterium]|nr:cytochrome c biogenesis protein ResB [Syntrophales bacterium]